MMRTASFASGVLAFGLLVSPASALKKVPYAEVPVTALPAFPGDPALSEMRKQLSAAVAAKDLEAVVKFVSPDFDWKAGEATVDDFDAKRGAVHNFKVALGFRAVGRDADGATDIGPQWNLLAYFANDEVLTQEKGSPLVCGSSIAKVADLGALDEAFSRIDEDDDLSEWVYSIKDLELTANPTGGAAAAKVKNVALPIVGLHPAPPSGDAKGGDAKPAAPTHFELLLPSGKTGWVPVANVRPLFVDRLCFAKAGDDWKIALYDQAE
jgi:hypothetical protein